MAPMELSAAEGSFTFYVYLSTYEYANKYDGPELPVFTFTDVCYCNSQHSFASNTWLTRYTVTKTEVSESRQEVKYTITVDYKANTTGSQRTGNVNVVRRTGPNSGTYLFSFPLRQLAN